MCFHVCACHKYMNAKNTRDMQCLAKIILVFGEVFTQPQLEFVKVMPFSSFFSFFSSFSSIPKLAPLGCVIVYLKSSSQCGVVYHSRGTRMWYHSPVCGKSIWSHLPFLLNLIFTCFWVFRGIISIK